MKISCDLDFELKSGRSVHVSTLTLYGPEHDVGITGVQLDDFVTDIDLTAEEGEEVAELIYLTGIIDDAFYNTREFER